MNLQNVQMVNDYQPLKKHESKVIVRRCNVGDPKGSINSSTPSAAYMRQSNASALVLNS